MNPVLPKNIFCFLCYFTFFISCNASAYISSDGDIHTIEYNKNGAILTSENKKHFVSNNVEAKVVQKKLKLYIGKDCDSFSEIYGKGTWEWANGGFNINFKGKSFSFPRQEVDIPNMDMSDCLAANGCAPISTDSKILALFTTPQARFGIYTEYLTDSELMAKLIFNESGGNILVNFPYHWEKFFSLILNPA